MGAWHRVTAADTTYRYLLWRNWGQGSARCVFIGLNPSTADATHDDATSRRCIGYAQRWGFDALVLINLFAYRSVEPRVLRDVVDPVGQHNDNVIDSVTRDAGLIVCAWGNGGRLHDRANAVVARLRADAHVLTCLGTQRCGEPIHPLYQRSNATPIALFNPVCGTSASSDPIHQLRDTRRRTWSSPPPPASVGRRAGSAATTRRLADDSYRL